MPEHVIRVLLVEDNPGDATLMRFNLSAQSGTSFLVETADRLSAAVDRLNADPFDVVLLDLSLPDAQGLDTLAAILEKAPRVPVIVLTGLDDEELAFKAMQLGAQDYLTKGTVDPRLLVRSIKYSLERTRTERELDEQRRRLETLMANIPDRIYFKNEKGEFLLANPALAKFLGVSHPGQTEGKTDADFFTEEHASEAMADEEEIMQTRLPLIGRVEKETFPDGRIGWSLTTKMPFLDQKGRVVGTFGVSRDITELKAAEDALRSGEERYRRLLNSVTDYVYTVELKDGAPFATSHGEGCLAVTGFSAEDFDTDALLWHRIIYPDDRGRVVDAFSDSTAISTSFELEHRIIRRDGAIRWVRNKLVSRYDHEGRLISFDGLISDITEKKLAADELQSANERLTRVLADLTKSHEELKAAQAQLIQLDKLHSIGQLAAGIAHEVKNPLQIILVGVQYLAECTVGRDEQTRGILAEMEEAVHRANGVVRGLLDFSSPRELGMEEHSINQLIEHSLRFLKHDLSTRKIHVEKKLGDGLPQVLVDPGKIEQVFINLFSNSLQAMPEGGILAVRSYEKTQDETGSSHDPGDRSGIRFRAGEKVLIVEVADTGTGIPPEKLHKVFEPFFTTKETGQGTGLGLSVVKKIIDLHKARINMANNPTGGLTATLTFKVQNLPTKAAQEK